MTLPTVRDATAALQTLLQVGAPDVDVLVGLDAGSTDAVKPRADPDGRVHVYAVVYPSPGQRAYERLAPGADAVAWSFQVTCVGGDVVRALACIDAITTALDGARLTGTAWASSPIEQVNDPGPVAEDRGASPSRWYSPLLFTTALTTTT